MSPRFNKIKQYFSHAINRHNWPVWLFLGLSVGLALVFIRLANQVNQLHRQVAVKAQNVEQLEQVNSRALSVKSDMDKIKNQTDELSILLPTRKQVLQNIELLEKIAAETANQQDITITELPPDPKRKTTAKKTGINVTLPDKFGSVDYTIDLTGGYVDLVNYLELIEHQPFLTIIRSLDIRAEKLATTNVLSGNSGKVHTTLNATLFYTKDKTQP